jgi:tRNA pseudouridine55 synthase
MNGLILLNKPRGVTSFQALNRIKKKLRIKKVGHTGTLDKFASGLLLVLTGPYTRLNSLFSHLDKEYIACIKMGTQTDTLDPEGKVIKESGIPDHASITRVLPQFTGEQEQMPPRYSAVHQDGERLYKKALRGEEINLPKRKIQIYELQELSYDPPFLRLRIHCSGGTYVRSLARDIGEAAGSCAHVTELVRTKIAGFQLSDAVTAVDFQPGKDLLSPSAFIPFLDTIQSIEVKREYREKISHGVPLCHDFFIETPERDGIYALFYHKVLYGCARKSGDTYKYLMVFGGK